MSKVKKTVQSGVQVITPEIKVTPVKIELAITSPTTGRSKRIILHRDTGESELRIYSGYMDTGDIDKELETTEMHLELLKKAKKMK